MAKWCEEGIKRSYCNQASKRSSRVCGEERRERARKTRACEVK